ncbi:MAG: alpha/beta hydrolase [Sphingomonadaceae bacterium]|nr:alpha/beta hydrolase [Sphingomonadaceae bacterium]
MSLEQVAPIAAAFRARRAQPVPPIEARRQGFEAQMANLPLPEDFTARPVQIAAHLGGLFCDVGVIQKRVLLWLHGGAFVLGSSTSYQPFAARLARASRARVLLPDYRLAPEHVFPAALDDVMGTLDWLEAQGYAMDQIGVGGDSAGANLALAAVQARAGESRQTPSALWLISPYLDLTHGGVSIRDRADRDPFIETSDMDATAGVYLGPASPADPRASPLFGNAKGLPPTLIQIGSEEVLFDDAARLRDAIDVAGGRVVFQEWAGMIHVWPLFAHAIEEGQWAIAQGGNFLQQIWVAE